MNKKTIGIIGIVLLVIVLIVGATIKPKEKDNTTTNGADILTNAQIESQNVKEDEQKETDVVALFEQEQEERAIISYKELLEKKDELIQMTTDDFSEEDFSVFENSNEKLKGFGTPMLLVVNNGNINDTVDGLTDTTHYIEFLKKNEIIK